MQPGVLLSLAVVLAVSAGADEVPLHEIAAQVGVDLDRDPVGTFVRPPDDSDPEMQTLVERYFELTPCGEPTQTFGLCEEALVLLRSGGDRLAEYLIVQAERSAAEGYPSESTYLEALGHTESPVAVAHLRSLVLARREAATAPQGSAERNRFLWALNGLGRTRAREAADLAIEVLETAEDPEVQIYAVNAFDRVQAKLGRLPDLQDRVRATRDRDAARDTTPGLPNPWRLVQRRLDRVLAEPGHTRP
jgi:hypothetical protein